MVFSFYSFNPNPIPIFMGLDFFLLMNIFGFFSFFYLLNVNSIKAYLEVANVLFPFLFFPKFYFKVANVLRTKTKNVFGTRWKT